MGKKRCFVVMGYGKKTDFKTGRTLDLDKVYRYMIKPAVQEAGLECVRGDEIPKSGTIDVSMYEELLDADVVVADLSTSNLNAIYELGVRYALRPRTTLVIAESRFDRPFDVNHIFVNTYVHHGTILDIEEASEFKAKLTANLEAILSNTKDDSPVYNFMPDLDPPRRRGSRPSTANLESFTASIADRRDDAQALLDAGNFVRAEGAFRRLVDSLSPADPSRADLTQRLALATYKSKQPSHVEALQRAMKVLEPLDPRNSNDPETLGLTGAIRKRLWEETSDRSHLDESIRAYERGFYIRRDYYNGINVAFMLDVRAVVQDKADERTADRVVARRTRLEVVEILADVLEELGADTPADIAESEHAKEQLYWVLSTKAEALVGLGDEEGAARVLAEAKPLARADWMTETTQTQLGKLRALLAADKQA